MCNDIKLHSITDLITNSSTVIYTYSGASVKACKELIDEIFNLLGINKKCDDVFVISVLAEENVYDEFISGDDDDEDYEDDDEDDELDDEREQIDGSTRVRCLEVEKIIEDVKHGRIEKPSWMKEAEQEEDCNGYAPETTLYIVAKDPKYEKLAKRVVNFLYSTNHEATRDG